MPCAFRDQDARRDIAQVSRPLRRETQSPSREPPDQRTVTRYGQTRCSTSSDGAQSCARNSISLQNSVRLALQMGRADGNRLLQLPKALENSAGHLTCPCTRVRDRAASRPRRAAGSGRHLTEPCPGEREAQPELCSSARSPELQDSIYTEAQPAAHPARQREPGASRSRDLSGGKGPAVTLLIAVANTAERAWWAG